MFSLNHFANFGNHVVAIAAIAASLGSAVDAAQANVSITIRLGSQPQYYSVPKYNNPYYSNYQRQNIYNIYNPRDRYYQHNEPGRVIIYNRHPDHYKPYKSDYRFRPFPYPVNVPAVNSGIYYR